MLPTGLERHVGGGLTAAQALPPRGSLVISRHSEELHLTQQANSSHMHTHTDVHVQTHTVMCACMLTPPLVHAHAHMSLSQALAVVCLPLSPRQRAGDWLWPVMQGHDWTRRGSAVKGFRLCQSVSSP